MLTRGVQAGIAILLFCFSTVFAQSVRVRLVLVADAPLIRLGFLFVLFPCCRVVTPTGGVAASGLLRLEARVMTAPAFGAVHRCSLVLALRTAKLASWIRGTGTSGMSAFPVFVYGHDVLLRVVRLCKGHFVCDLAILSVLP